MAEGLANYLKLNKKFQIHSAGVEAHGLNTRAVEVMDEIGIDISHHQKQINWKKVKKWREHEIKFVYIKNHKFRPIR